MNSTDPALLQAIQQTNANWALVWEAQRTFYITIAGVMANLLLAFVAVAVPAWQRISEKRDAKQAAKRAWDRFIDAFTALSDAQSRVFLAGYSDAHSASAYTDAEAQIQCAIEALAKASATELPVQAVLNSVAAQQVAATTLARLPNLKVYGKNLLTFKEVHTQFEQAAMKTDYLLNSTIKLAKT